MKGKEGRKMASFCIEDVVRLNHLDVKKKGTEYYFPCPVCGESGACSYNPAKNKWHDWKCDAGGGPIDLFIALTSDPEKRAIYESSDGIKAAARDIFKALDGDTYVPAVKIEPMPARIVQKKASDEHCSRVYTALLQECTLEKVHYQKLLDRGLSSEQINKYMFKSVPKDTKGVSRRLLKKGYVLKGVPGFFLNKGEWDLKIPYNHRLHKRETGTFCPVFDGERNLLLGFQINVDKPYDWDILTEDLRKEYIKYVWLSSKDLQMGVTSGSMATFLPGKADTNAVIVTEGILKATVIYCLLGEQVSVIGIPGVKLFKSAIPYIERFKKQIYVFDAYDMDKELPRDRIYLKERTEEELSDDEMHFLRKVNNLADADMSMRTMFLDRGIKLHALKWDIGGDGIWNGNYKGLDDFLNDYGDRDRFLGFILKKAQDGLKVREDSPLSRLA